MAAAPKLQKAQKIFKCASECDVKNNEKPQFFLNLPTEVHQIENLSIHDRPLSNENHTMRNSVDRDDCFGTLDKYLEENKTYATIEHRDSSQYKLKQENSDLHRKLKEMQAKLDSSLENHQIFATQSTNPLNTSKNYEK